MLKGIVMEINEKTMFLLTDSGEFKEVRKPKETIVLGHEYNSKNSLINIDFDLFRRRKLAIIMLTILLILPTTISYTYFQPQGYINIDINPSVEIAYNAFNRVIDVKSINADGIKIIEDNLKIDNMKTEDAIKTIITKAEKLGFINESRENLVLITVTSKNTKDSLKYEGDSFKSDEYEVEVINANEEDHNEAGKLGISTGKIVIDKMIKAEKSKEKKEILVKIYKKFNDEFESDEGEVPQVDNENINNIKKQLEKTEEIKTKKEENRLEKTEEDKIERNEEDKIEKNKEDKIERNEELAEKKKIKRENEDILRKEQIEKVRKDKGLEKEEKEKEVEKEEDKEEEKNVEKSKDNQKGGNSKKD
ncbi:MAG: anti-sigma factor domain-containing protein [Acidaminobacteraceae bacterium]